MLDLAIIIVSWNVRELLCDCLHGVAATLAASELRYTVLVVDNASTDGTVDMVRAEFPAVRLIETGSNLGFSGGNNVGLRALGFEDEKRKTKDDCQTLEETLPRYVMLLNPDTVPQGDALVQLVKTMDAHNDLVVAGPELRYGDGSLQSSRRRFPTPGTFFWESTPLGRLWAANPWAQQYHYTDVPAGREQRVGWLVGAALLVRSSAVEEAGLLDEGFFMYSEELEWQLRLQRGAIGAQKLRDIERRSCIAYVPSAVVTHYEGRSSGQILAGRHLYFQRSKLRLARMMYGRAFALLFRLFLLGCYTADLAVETAKLLVGHRRGLRQQRISVYTEVLRGLVAAPL